LVILAPRSFETPVSRGEVALAWLNSHSSILLMTSGATLVIDPVNVALPERVRPDGVVVTHSHIDHFDRALLAGWQKEFGVPVLTSAFVAARMSGEAKVLRVGDRASVGDIDLLAEHCVHHATEPLSLVISSQNAPTVFHPADSDPFADMARLRREHEPQVMLFTGPSMRKAVEIAGLIKPRVLVSCGCDADWEGDFSRQVRDEVPQTEVMFLRPLEVCRLRL
jgi:L-ascorbate metabolism protein UlaG (beta-lactamase superfamily)